MRNRRVCFSLSALSAALLAATLAAGPAAAAETFVCDDGRVLTLTQEQVNVLVNTDPCIAKYFGRTIAPQVPAEPPPAAIAVDVPPPERKPEQLAAELRRLKIDPTAPASLVKPVEIADVPSDFRNVHVINGGTSGSPEYYKHTR